MSTAAYTEDSIAQQTTADYLRDKLGWKSAYAYNNEDLGQDSLLGRNSEREVVLTRPLHDRLAALNPGLPGATYDDAVRQLTAAIAAQALVATSREKYGLMRALAYRLPARKTMVNGYGFLIWRTRCTTCQPSGDSRELTWKTKGHLTKRRSASSGTC